MDPTTTVALVTGGNRGIGRAVAELLTGLGWRVAIGVRDAAAGDAVAEEIGCVAVQLDVTDDASVEAAAQVLEDRYGRLDVLVNNAGVGRWIDTLDATVDDVRTAFETNVYGVVRVTRAFLPLMERSPAPRIVNVSSGLGSFGVTTDPDRFESKLHGLHYPASKAALNMVTTQYAKALPAFRINAVAPGNTATAFNDYRGAQSLEEGSEAIVTYAQVAPDGPTGGYFDRFGPVAW